jgi:glycosyltransferase involved in cell wall biosynthesis
MPHGSAIEYAVKKDQRFFNYAVDAFTNANRIYVIGKELRQRIKILFPEIIKLENKIFDLNLGVDTSLFQPITRKERSKNIDILCKKIKSKPRGKTVAMSTLLREDLFPEINQSQLMDLFSQYSDYNPKQADHGIESRLRLINWEYDRILLFVGRLIASKGIQAIIAALPAILEKYPKSRLIVVGHGPLREPLEGILVGAWQLICMVYDNLLTRVVRYSSLENSCPAKQ